MNLWLDQGGPILKILLALNGIGWTIMLWKSISIFLFMRRIKQQKNLFDSYFKQYQTQEKWISTQEKLSLALSHYMDPFYGGMDTIRVIASISPLLGLLGTVWGILNSFSVIAQQGLDNPSLFATGISMALITTVGGLVVAIPHFVGYNYLKGFLVVAEKKLEKKILCSE